MNATSIALRLRRPFLAEARAYCDEHKITDADECERVRLSMAVRELRIRMEPWNAMAARTLALYLPGTPAFHREVERVAEQLRSMRARFAADLGIDLPAT